MRQSVIIFGGIGTLVETSSLQRHAFNDAFEKLDIDFHWDTDSYRDSLAGTGGQRRLAALVLKDGTRLSPRQIEQLHALKTERFVSRLTSIQLDLRPGVGELIDHARQTNLKLAWATTTSCANIDALISSTNGALRHDMFAFLGNDTIVTRQKPDPQIYTMCLAALNIAACEAIAIEDGLMGIASAKAAGICTIAFPGEFQASQDFHLADLIVRDLTALIEVPTN
jgi:HAD superfamily hydrolase (TIGR01509 family)